MRKLHIIFPRSYDFSNIKPRFSIDLKGKPVMAKIIRSTFTVEGAHFVVDIPKEADIAEIISALEKNGAKAFQKSVMVDPNECIECGQCTALCAYDALVLDENFNIKVNQENCTGCRACLDACPRRCISVY
ncbi:MAG: ATP-binding protein [Promethearchaeota archaeon]